MNEELEERIYELLCKNCPKAKQCHEECDYCDKFYEEYDKEPNCMNCTHSYYEDLYYELCCDRDKKYIGELHSIEKAKGCKNYEKDRRLL